MTKTCEDYLVEIDQVVLEMTTFTDFSGEHAALLIACLTKIRRERNNYAAYVAAERRFAERQRMSLQILNSDGTYSDPYDGVFNTVIENAAVVYRRKSREKGDFYKQDMEWLKLCLDAELDEYREQVANDNPRLVYKELLDVINCVLMLAQRYRRMDWTETYMETATKRRETCHAVNKT